MLSNNFSEVFIDTFNTMANGIHETAVEKGWWNNARSEGEIIALIHSELSEALEYLRNHDKNDDKLPQFKGIEVELADAIIRIMDYAKAFNYNVAEALVAKVNYNKTRPYLHGKLF